MSLIQTIAASALAIVMILAAIFYELYDITKELRESNRLKKLELELQIRNIPESTILYRKIHNLDQ